MVRRRRRKRLPASIRLPRFHRRRPVVSLIVITLSVLIWFNRSDLPRPLTPPTGGDYERYHDREFTVVKVVDGDTIDIDAPDRDKPSTRIRLWGVDTPEVAGSPRGRMYWGPQASAFAKATLLDTRVRLELVEGDTRGKFGRLLAYVYAVPSGEMFNERLLREGFAYADRRFNHPWQQRFKQLEDRTRRRMAGLWHNVTPEQMPEWRQRYEQWRASKSK